MPVCCSIFLAPGACQDQIPRLSPCPSKYCSTQIWNIHQTQTQHVTVHGSVTRTQSHSGSGTKGVHGASCSLEASYGMEGEGASHCWHVEAQSPRVPLSWGIDLQWILQPARGRGDNVPLGCSLVASSDPVLNGPLKPAVLTLVNKSWATICMPNHYSPLPPLPTWSWCGPCHFRW